MKKLREWLPIVLLFIFITITILVITNQTKTFDDTIYNTIISFRNPLLDWFLKIITKFGNRLFIFILLIIMLLIIKEQKYRYILGIEVILITLGNIVLKNIIARIRPDHLRLIKQGGYSYPSGHAMISIAVYGFLIFYIYKKVKEKKAKVFLITLLTLLIIGIGISRIYLGVHYPSDVLAGYILASIILQVVISKISNRGNINDKDDSN